MGFIRKWGKEIIVVVVLASVLSLAAGRQMPLSPEVSETTEEAGSKELSPPPKVTASPELEEMQELPTDHQSEATSEAALQAQVAAETSSPPQPTTITESRQHSEATSAPSSQPTVNPTPPEKVEQDICAGGHDFYKSVWETPTCLKGGYYNKICNRCGLVESVAEAPLPHDVEDILIHEGNCMQDTIIRHICKSCGQQVEGDTRYTPQIHKWVDSVVDGREVTYCDWCGVVQ